MPNDAQQLLDHLKEAVRERETPLIRPLAEGDVEAVRHFEREAIEELNVIGEQELDDLWEIASLPARIEGAQGLASIAAAFVKPPVHLFTATVTDGCHLIGTPYDHDWNIGLGQPLARVDGKAFALGPDDGQSASGFAVDLTSDTELDAAITPMGEYTFSAFATQAMPELRSRGGLGVKVFGGPDFTPIFSRTVQLFEFNRPAAFSGVSGNGLVADAATPTLPGTFGPVTLAPVHVRLSPGRRIQVWFWAWVITSNAAGAWALTSFRVPAVRVCAGPPIIVH